MTMERAASHHPVPRTHPSAFRPAWWLPGGHLQTLYATYLKRAPRLALETELFELPDGDCTRGYWVRPLDPGKPLVILLPGLEGGPEAPYVRGLSGHLSRAGFGILILPFRGTWGNPNRQIASYHAGWTGDLDWILTHLEETRGLTPFALAGFSLGGNMMLHWLANAPRASRIRQAVGVSIPFDLSCVAHRMKQGAGRLYQAALVRDLRRTALRALADYSHPALQAGDLKKLRTFLDFDGRYVAPLYGFQNAEDYYSRTSSRAILARIRTPTLIIQALDDPIIPPCCLPHEQEWSDSTVFEWSPKGGHVGFIEGHWPGWGRHWLGERISEVLLERLGRS